MQSENRFFDDFAKMMNGLAGTVAGMGREAGEAFKEKNREWLGGMDFVSRDEFEAVKAMAAAARDEVEVLRARLDAVQGPEAAGSPAGAVPPAGDAGNPGAVI